MNRTIAIRDTKSHRRWWRFLLAVLLTQVAWHSAWSTAFAATPPPVTIPATGDAYLAASQPTTNYGSGPLGVTPGASALVNFDISGLPAASHILSAKLRMLPNDIIGTGASTVNISRVDGPWDEATVTPATAPTAIATGVSAVVSGYVFIEWDVTATVREWHRGAAPSDGFMLTTADPGVYFHAKETGTAPELVIEFEVDDQGDDPVNPGRRAHPELGDAPDSTNHHGIANTAYPATGTPGNFPTVWNDPTGAPSGPMHFNEHGEGWLGYHASAEREADMGADMDGVNNIILTAAGPADVANRDRGDDGWLNRNAPFVDCTRTTLDIRVSHAMTPTLEKMYLNVWFDGNRDGDWADGGQCQQDPNGPTDRSHEWIVRDFVVDMTAIPAGGFQDIAVNTLAVMNSTPDAAHWTRFMLSERPAVKPAATTPADGRGPQHPNGYRFGETEDYFQRPAQEPNGADMAVRKRGRVQQEFNPETGTVVSKIAWAIEYHNIGAVAAQQVTLRDFLDREVDLNTVLLDVRTAPEIPYAIDGQSLVFRAGEVAPGGSGRIAIIMATRQLTVSGRIITNTVVVNAENDANGDNNEAKARVEVGLRAPRILSPINGSTCRNEVEIIGLANPGAEVDLHLDETVEATVTADVHGRWRHSLKLNDGRHTVYAVARIGGANSAPSKLVDLIVDSTLLWNPISLTFTDERGRVRQPKDTDGRLDGTGWSLSLRPNTTYTVSVEICCDDGNAEVTLAVVGIDTVLSLTNDNGDGIYTATFRTGPRNAEPAAMTLTVVCGDSTVTSSGDVVLIDPEGVVFNVFDGSLITDANVACMEANVAAAEDGSTSFALWDADTYGQVNPQMTAADGYFSFMTPAGTYRIVVNKAGYQSHTSPDLEVISDAVRYDVPLTPVIAEEAGAVVSISATGFEPAILTVEPGTVIEWTNVDDREHSASSENEASAAGLNANGIVFDSGLLGSGERYKIQLNDKGTYTVFDRANPANSATIVVAQAEVTQPLQNQIFLPLVTR